MPGRARKQVDFGESLPLVLDHKMKMKMMMLSTAMILMVAASKVMELN